MTPSFQTTAAIRYGFGLSPVVEAPKSTDEMLTRLRGPDHMASEHPITDFDQRARDELALMKLRRARRKKVAGADQAFRKANRSAAADLMQDMRTSLIRPMVSPDGFRERLVRFWADHFTVAGKGKGLRYVTTGYVEQAIRPHITGSFRTLLGSASLHPAMLVYLDQVLSFGPNSEFGKSKKRGLNENLAREVLELHTLGVGAHYTQTDVRQFAKLLTGLYYHFRRGTLFRHKAAEPGPQTVLGRQYGGPDRSIDDIHAFFDDLAVHPDTAHHIAHKLAVHFVSDTPDAALVDHVTAAFVASDGDLMTVYSALLEHPAAWQNFGSKAKQPFDFLVSSMRAMDAPIAAIDKMSFAQSRRDFFDPMQVMGQTWQQPSGPDGWPENIEDWITPQGLAARVDWALLAAEKLDKGHDPRALAQIALAELADDRFKHVVGGAESRREGIALLLSSPEFNRR